MAAQKAASVLRAAGLPDALMGEGKHLVPRSLLPASVTDAEYASLSRPDALVLDARDSLGPEQVVIYVVEVKVKDDTQPEAGEEAAESQHGQLLALLGDESTGRQARLVTITLGVSGTIYLDSLVALRTLGVEDKQAAKVMAQAHTALCQWLGRIVALKRQEEAGLGVRLYSTAKRSGPGPPRTGPP